MKKVRLSYGNLRISRLANFKKRSFFYRVKELFKSNPTRYAVSPVYVESETKRIFVIACLGKKLVLQSEISSYLLILFSKI